MTDTASPSWDARRSGDRSCRPPRRALEIVGIVFAFVWFWPLAVAYIVWKLMGYPVPAEFAAFMERNFTWLRGSPFAARSGGAGGGPAAGPTGNSAFDDYRRSELERLEAERRRLDEEAREFSAFLDELRKARDREEFDAYMRRRRQAAPAGRA